jgi:heme exporter protein C
VYWTWDPRLTTLLLTVLVYSALTLLRRFSGDSHAERKFAAAFGVLGTILLPIIHYSVKLWRGNHPTVIGKGGGGLAPEMLRSLLFGFATMALLAVTLIIVRKSLALAESRLREAEELGSTFLLDGEED